MVLLYDFTPEPCPDRAAIHLDCCRRRSRHFRSFQNVESTKERTLNDSTALRKACGRILVAISDLFRGPVMSDEDTGLKPPQKFKETRLDRVRILSNLGCH